MPALYIPPPDIRFRLVGYVTNRVLYSRNSPDPQVYHYPAEEEATDQYFQLIPGTGDREGTYAIKGTVSGKVLFLRGSPEPYFGHISGDGEYPDNWFKLEVGTVKYAENFRLVNVSSNLVLYSRTNAEPQLGKHTPDQPSADQYWGFLFEDMKVAKVEYDIKEGRILSSTPKVIGKQTVVNKSDVEQESSFALTESETHTALFERTTGFTITLGTSFKAGIPFVGETEFNVETSFSQEWKFGESNEYNKTWSIAFPVRAAPHSEVKAISTINSGNIEIPYTIHLVSKATGAKAQAKGVFRGVTTWDLRHTIIQTPLDDS